MTPRPVRLVGLVSILVDVTLEVPQLPPRGGDVLARAAGAAAGGGINALAAAARLGLPAVYAGPHGSGPYGDVVRRALAADGIGCLAAPTTVGDTGHCVVLLEPEGERTFVTVPGVEAVQTAESLAALALEPGDVVYASGYDLLYPGSGPALSPYLAALPAVADGGPWLVVDPGPLVGAVPEPLLWPVLARADLISISADEVDQVGGTAALPSRLHGEAALLVRDGPAGVSLTTATTSLLAAGIAAPGPVVDTTGAGDVHLGALLAGLSAGDGWEAALTLANKAAAWSVTRPGASTGPTRAELAAAFPGEG